MVSVRIAGMVQDSIVDGPGLRFVVFTQGCDSCCDGCHNPETWDKKGGSEASADEIIAEMLQNPLTDGLTLTGGEPFLQAGECALLANAARENGLNVWLFTGYTFEELVIMAQSDKPIESLLKLADVLVDGRFIKEERTLQLKWRGSKNQRVIDARKSLVSGEAVVL